MTSFNYFLVFQVKPKQSQFLFFILPWKGAIKLFPVRNRLKCAKTSERGFQLKFSCLKFSAQLTHNFYHVIGSTFEVEYQHLALIQPLNVQTLNR